MTDEQLITLAQWLPLVLVAAPLVGLLIIYVVPKLPRWLIAAVVIAIIIIEVAR